jgi:hypothetical protein
MLVLLQAATVAVAGATDHETAKMLRSLTLIGPTAFRGNSNSVLLNAWAYLFGAILDSVGTLAIHSTVFVMGGWAGYESDDWWNRWIRYTESWLLESVVIYLTTSLLVIKQQYYATGFQNGAFNYSR